ncbi:hypothetical protein, partial [Streptomyces sp. NPDC051183]|uniref:hypothetical protein n=1 Tax=Streptomyces sp. NPDC051183 TaxID=3155165 RepID=UPI00342F4E83
TARNQIILADAVTGCPDHDGLIGAIGLAVLDGVGVRPKLPSRVRMNVPSYVADRSTAEEPG